MKQLLIPALALSALAHSQTGSWTPVETNGSPTKRHECAFIEAKGKFYLMGGRGDKAIDIYDPASKTWSEGPDMPMEMHHFQPVVYKDRIYVIGAMTGPYPDETPLPNIWIFDPASGDWSQGPKIPELRRRGAAGVVVLQDRFYIVNGIVDGHNGEFVNWLDEYDPATGGWRKLPDSPRPRDHFQAAVVNGKIYAAGGRTTSKRTGKVFDLVISEVDVYDPGNKKWSTLPSGLPTPRGGSYTVSLDGNLIVLGGESMAQKAAHSEVEAYDVKKKTWTTLAPLGTGRHGTGAIVFGGKIYVCAGSGGRGGGPELTTMEVFTWKAK